MKTTKTKTPALTDGLNQVLADSYAPPSREVYVKRLIAANEKLLADAARARDLAGKANDAQSRDLMLGRITLHQKTVSMLRSFLKT